MNPEKKLDIFSSVLPFVELEISEISESALKEELVCKKIILVKKEVLATTLVDAEVRLKNISGRLRRDHGVLIAKLDYYAKKNADDVAKNKKIV